MPRLIESPTEVEAAGEPPKTIREFVGRVNTSTSAVSVALMESPVGWREPGQRPSFDEFTLVLEGELLVESAEEPVVVRAGQAVHAAPGEWVRYSTPTAGARYVAVCVPAFSPEEAGRDDA